jgi:hypothetical protein
MLVDEYRTRQNMLRAIKAAVQELAPNIRDYGAADTVNVAHTEWGAVMDWLDSRMEGNAAIRQAALKAH